MSIAYGLIVSCSTGSSINTSFSAVATTLPAGYQGVIVNSTSFTLGLYVGTSAPTVTAADQLYIPTNFAYSLDSNHGGPVVPKDANLYIRAANLSTTGIVSNTVMVNLNN